MSYNPVNPNGQAAAASSAPSVLSSDFKSSGSNIPVAVPTGLISNSIGGTTYNYTLPANNNVTSINVFNATTTNYLNVYTTAKILYGYYAFNTTSSTVYLGFKDSASTTLAISGNAPNFQLMIPAYAAANLTFPIPVSFALGINITAVTAFSGTTQVSTGSAYITLWVN
jgi:hypothetical protein